MDAFVGPRQIKFNNQGIVIKHHALEHGIGTYGFAPRMPEECEVQEKNG
jgi:hypothetical protein